MKEIKIYEIPNIDFVERIDDPYIGMIFYVSDIDTYYSVKTLKEINGINMKGNKVVEYVIDEYADFGTGGGGGTGLTPTQLSNIAKIPAIQSTVDALPNNYASKNHNHSGYASSSHRHDASEIDNLPSGGGSGEGLTSTQKQQLQTAYTHSQSAHVSMDKVNEAIANAQLSGGEVDLSAYATKTYTDNAISNALDGHTFKFLTQAEYDVLSDDEKNSSTIEYHITDSEEYQFSLSYRNNVLSLLKGNAIISQVTITSSTNPDDPIVTYGNIVLSKTSVAIVKGESDTFTVKLDQAPTNEQVVTLTSVSPEVTLSASSLTFTSENYNVAQEVRVNVSSDTSAESAIITCSTNGTNKTINISITESTATPTTFTITNNLNNVANMNKSVTTVNQNESYDAMLRPTINYVIENATVTMGGVDVTSDVYHDASINITAVTGDIVISATGREANVTVSGGTLIHSYDLTQAAEDGTYTDTVGGWNLDSAKKAARNASLPNVDRFASFSVVITGTFNDSYYHAIFHTGPAGGINITTGSPYYPTLGGRLLLVKGIAHGKEVGDVCIDRYYKTDDNSLVEKTYLNANIPQGTNTTIVLTSDADANTTKIYVGGFLAYTLNQKSNLDGLVVDDHISNASLQIYSGVVEVGV